MQEVRDAEGSREAEEGAGRTVVAHPPFRAGRVKNEVGVAQEALDRCARDRALSVVVEDDPALPIGERDEPNSDPVAIRNRLLEIGAAWPARRRADPRVRPRLPPLSSRSHILAPFC